MNDDQAKEAIALLHKARRLIQLYDSPNHSPPEHEEALEFLADTEGLLVDGLGERVEYLTPIRAWSGPGELERTGYIDANPKPKVPMRVDDLGSSLVVTYTDQSTDTITDPTMIHDARKNLRGITWNGVSKRYQP